VSRRLRLLPLIAVAICGVVAIDALENGPGMIGAVRSFAEDVTAPKGGKPPAVSPTASLLAGAATPAKPPAPVCAPTAAELAKEAGLSPAELQVLQSLGDRRGQLDDQEQSLDTQVQLIAAAEAKLDGRIQQMNDLKAGIQALLGQADQQQQDETDRLVRVYEAMKPKDAAARVTLLSDAVRLPMAAKMKERALSAILAQMTPDDARVLTEKLADRLSGAQAVAAARTALNPQSPPAANPPPPAQAAAPPAAQDDQASADATPKPAAAPKAKPKRVAKRKPHPKAPVQQAAKAPTPPSAAPAPAAATPTTPAKAG
jgi:flagellar motility protein MotE (MotC chaperone)